MTWKDKLEIGLKEDAPYRKDNLPEHQVRGAEIPAGEKRSPVIPAARHDVTKTGQGTAEDARQVSTPDKDEFSNPKDNDSSRP
jgi:hypothetical protein